MSFTDVNLFATHWKIAFFICKTNIEDALHLLKIV